MAETKFTPGPWLAAAKPSSIVGWPVVGTQSGRSICDVTYVQHTQIDPAVPGDRSFNTESAANARLIAAAPDLFAVAEAYEQWEADLILCNAAWETRGEQAAILTQELYDRLMEIQAMRNTALAKALSPSPPRQDQG